VLAHPEAGVRTATIGIVSRNADARWQWPVRIGSLAEAPSDAQAWATLPNGLAIPVTISRFSARVEVLLARGTLKEVARRVLALDYALRATHVVIQTPMPERWEAQRAYLDLILGETQAVAVTVVSPAAGLSFIPATVRGLTRQLSFDESLYAALKPPEGCHFVVAESVGIIKGPIDSQGMRLFPWKEPVDDVRVRRHDEDLYRGPINVKRGPRRRVDKTPEKPAEQPFRPTSEARYLQAQLKRASDDGSDLEPTKFMVVNKPHGLRVKIDAPDSAFAQVDAPFPSVSHDDDTGAVTLDLYLVERDQLPKPLAGAIQIPIRHGASSSYEFAFTPRKKGGFKGRIIVARHGRILQTAALSCEVVETPTLDAAGSFSLEVDAVIQEDFATLSSAGRFDGSLLLEREGDGVRLIGTTAEGAYAADLDRMPPALRNIAQQFAELGLAAKELSSGLQSKRTAKWMREVAREGIHLYNIVVRDYVQKAAAAAQIERSEYVQIVCLQADAVLPLELAYEYPDPDNNAPVCPNALEALKSGSCPSSCRPTQGPAQVVCPMGFWGLRKVIERHAFDPGLPKAALIKGQTRNVDRTVGLQGHVVVGLSAKIDAASRKNLEKSVKRLSPGQVTIAKDWAQWREAVARNAPRLHLLLPHTAGAGGAATLEIQGNEMRSISIDPNFLSGVKGQEGPVVLLLGCDVAAVAETSQYASHIAVFRRADAALVLGTIAAILAPQAATMATRLVEALAELPSGQSLVFGEVLRDTKRRAVADGHLVALALAAFGDADIHLRT
jgi:hypothetical protein